jgi:hypothetical protein
MTDDEEFHVKERISALHEARGKTVTSRSLSLYWDALRHLDLAVFDAACAKANELGTIHAEHIRAIARDLKRDGANQTQPGWRCHAHGDGQYEPGGVGYPERPSCNPTMSWCDRCRYYVSRGQQKPDPNGPQLQRVGALITDLTERYP